MILVEVNLCSARVGGFNPTQNNLMMAEHLDLLDECREAATIASRVSAKPYSALQPRCEDKRVQCWRLGAMKSSKEQARHKCWKVGSYLGRTL